MKNSSNAVLSSESYTYNAVSNVLTATRDSVATTYTYDAIDQLLSETRSGYAASYTYDANGNRATRTVNGLTETYSNDAGDKLTGVTWTGGSKSFTYDAAGRTTSITTASGATNLVYDYESRVTSITYPNASVDTFSYNGLDTRVGKGGAQGSATFKRNGVGVTAPVLSDGAATYTPGISERRSGSTTYSHSGIKNAEVQTNSGQSVSATNQYDAFGNLASSTGTWKGPFGYGGPFGYQSDASGLKLLGHRYYDSGTGRFLTRDPVKDGENWYGYCYGSPVSLADNNGELPFLVVLFLWGVAAGGVMELCPILPSPGGIAKGVEKGVAKGIAKEVLVEVGESAAKQAVRKHHWIPREIVRLLEEIGIKDARIRGVKGAPNIYLVPKDWQMMSPF